MWHYYSFLEQLKGSFVIARSIAFVVSHTSVMRDVCDGSVWSENELYSRNSCSLQIFLNTGDIEIVNPIAAHVKHTK